MSENLINKMPRHPADSWIIFHELLSQQEGLFKKFPDFTTELYISPMTDITANIPDAQLVQIGSKITEGVSRIIDNVTTIDLESSRRAVSHSGAQQTPLFAVDLKLLKYLRKYEMQPGEEEPSGQTVVYRQVEQVYTDSKRITGKQWLRISRW